MRKISAWLRDYFAFSHTEARGAVLLVAFTLLAITIAEILSVQATGTPPSAEEDRRMLNRLAAVLDSMEHVEEAEKNAAVESFPFNPNTVDSATLTQLGLSAWVAQRVVHYREKGGRFRYREEFKKIYGLPETTYRRLYSFIQLPKRQKPKNGTSSALPSMPKTAASQPAGSAADERATHTVNINMADTSELKQLPGIGSTLALRIVKYRQKLGGYRTIDQLEEVYHMTELGTVSLKARAYVRPEDAVRRLNINRADAKTLAQHPYISWDLARALVQHRQNYGDYRSLDDLREVYLMTEKVLEKVAPYLEI